MTEKFVNEPEPLVAGGQGRESRDVLFAAYVVTACGLGMLIITVVALVAAALGWRAS